MSGARRLIASLLLLCVSLALGDAPYVDEYLDSLRVQEQWASAAAAGHNDDLAPSTTSIELCQNLLILSCTSDSVPAADVGYASRFAQAGAVAYSSTVPRRLDRPPMRLTPA